VAVISSGEDVGASGYSVNLNGSPKAAIGANGSVTLSDLTPGTHSVALEGLPENCSFTTDNPVSLSVTAGATTDASFAVSCVSAVGSLEVSVSTGGEAVDEDGYTVSVIGGPSGTVDANGTVTLTDVPVGNRSVELSDVSGNCDVSAPNPRLATIAFEQTTQVAFEVTCIAPPPGTIAFLSERDNNPQREVFLMNGAGGNVTQITDMPNAGEKNTALLSPDGSKVLFDTWEGRDLWVVNTDGTGLLNVTASPWEEDAVNAAWSPDGSKIAFSRNGDDQDCANGGPDACGFWTVNSDGSGLTRLIEDTGDMFQGGSLDWSADGSKILFIGYLPGSAYCGRGIYVVNSDGSQLQPLVDECGQPFFPKWSPDGSMIAFSQLDQGASYTHLYVMNPDGTGQTQLTDDALGFDAWTPVWSPDGSRIAFGCVGLCVINPDGSGLETVIDDPWPWTPPAWAPDGSTIAFTADPGGVRDVYTIRTDGTGLNNLTNLATHDYLRSWSP